MSYAHIICGIINENVIKYKRHEMKYNNILEKIMCILVSGLNKTPM